MFSFGMWKWLNKVFEGSRLKIKGILEHIFGINMKTNL